MSIQSFVLRRCVSASSSGFPTNSALKCDQFNCGNEPGCASGITICSGGAGGTTGCTGGMGGCACGSPSAIFLISSVRTI